MIGRSQDFRVRLLKSDKPSAHQMAACFKVGVSQVTKSRQRRDRPGEVETQPRGSRHAPLQAGHGNMIAMHVKRHVGR